MDIGEMDGAVRRGAGALPGLLERGRAEGEPANAGASGWSMCRSGVALKRLHVAARGGTVCAVTHNFVILTVLATAWGRSSRTSADKARAGAGA
jgi:hypothetical protein